MLKCPTTLRAQRQYAHFAYIAYCQLRSQEAKKPNQEASKINVFIIFSPQLSKDDSPLSAPPSGMLQP